MKGGDVYWLDNPFTTAPTFPSSLILYPVLNRCPVTVSCLTCHQYLNWRCRNVTEVRVAGWVYQLTPGQYNPGYKEVKMEQKFKMLAEPIPIGPMVAQNRIWMSPMLTRFASMGGEVTQVLIDHYVARAKGGIGLITQEIAAVDRRHTYKEPHIGIYADKFLPGLHRLVEAVHMYDVPIIVQLHHAGMFGTDPVAPSTVAAYDLGAAHYVQPRALSIAEIEDIRELFIESALRAKAVEYDGVELHGATAYLLEQFFSPHANKRTDK